MNYMGTHTALILTRQLQEKDDEIYHLNEKLDIMTEVLMAAQESWMRNLDDATSITYMARDALDKCSDLETKFNQALVQSWEQRDAANDAADRAYFGGNDAHSLSAQ